MPYFRVDDGFNTHPKVLAIPRRYRAAAIGLWAMAGVHCAHHLTDGRIAKHMVEEFGSSKKYADFLVSTGLWTEDDDSYILHEFVSWQGASRDEVLAKKEAEAERKRRWREEQAARRSADNGHVPPVSQRDNPRTDTGTSPSVPPSVGAASGPPSPPLPSPPHPSPSLVPYGDKREGESSEPDARDDAHEPPPPEPPLCLKHTGWNRDDVPACRACGTRRTRWETDVAEHQAAAAAEAAARPPCRLHTGQDADTCRSCAADRKAAPEPAGVAS